MPKKASNTEIQLFLEECKEKLPKAAKEKRRTEELKEIVTNYSFSLSTAENYLRKNNLAFKPPAKTKPEPAKKRLTDIEKTQIYSFYNFHKWDHKKIHELQVLGDRTPTAECILDVLLEFEQNYPHWTCQKSQEVQDKVLELKDQGFEIKDITRALNSGSNKISKKTIERILKYHGYRISPGKTPEEKQLIYDTYMELGTHNCIPVLEENGITSLSPTTIRRIVREFTNAGYPSRDNSDSYRRYTLNKNFFEVIDTEEKAYCLGFIAADGHVRKSERRIEIELKSSDKNVLERVIQALGNDQPVRYSTHYDHRYNKTYHSANLAFYSKKLVMDLRKYGIKENKSEELNINFELIPIDLQRHFWRGFTDGDGTLHYRNYKETVGVTFAICGVLNICNSFKKYISDKLNITMTIKPMGTIFEAVNQRKKDILKITKLLYSESNIYLDRKQKRADLWIKCFEGNTISKVQSME